MTGPRIPETQGVSGTWAALEKTAPVDSSEPMAFHFNGHTVRGWLIADEPTFIAADVARALGYRMASDMTRRIDVVDKGYTKVRTPGGDQEMAVINESGMYTAIFRANIEEAQEFRRWVTKEVLPAIRRTGSYSRYPAQPTALPSKTELAQWVIEAEQRAEAAEALAEARALPAAAWNELAEAAGDYAVADAAKVLSRDSQINTGERRLFQAMAGYGWVFKRDGRWRAYQRHVDVGWLTEKVGRPYLRDEVMHNGEPTVRITPKGLAALHRLLGGSGQLALVASS